MREVLPGVPNLASPAPTDPAQPDSPTKSVLLAIKQEPGNPPKTKGYKATEAAPDKFECGVVLVKTEAIDDSNSQVSDILYSEKYYTAIFVFRT